MYCILHGLRFVLLNCSCILKSGKRVFWDFTSLLPGNHGTLFGMRSFSDHLLNKPNVCLCLKSSSLFSETQTTLSFRFGHSNCFQSTSWYVPWLVKMRVCHITAVVPDDLLHAPTQKSFPIALQLSIGRPVNSAELHQLLTPSLSARMNAAFQIAAQH